MKFLAFFLSVLVFATFMISIESNYFPPLRCPWGQHCQVDSECDEGWHCDVSWNCCAKTHDKNN